MRLRKLSGAVACVLLAGVLTACNSGQGNSGGLEKPEITVGMMPIVDSASFQVAIEHDLFKKAGFTKVTPRPIQTGAESLQQMVGGTMDFGFTSYVSLFNAVSGSTDVYKKMRVISDAYAANTGSFQLLVKDSSPIRKLEDLKGKRIAISAPKNVTQLLNDLAMRGRFQVAPEQFVAVKHQNMQQKLEADQVDAITQVEPFITQIKKAMPTREVVDLLSGQARNFPIACFAVSQDFIDKYPKTAKAFKEVMTEAQRRAGDRRNVEKILPTHARIPAETAAAVKLGIYPTTVSAERMQRVADLLYDMHYITNRLKADTVIANVG